MLCFCFSFCQRVLFFVEFFFILPDPITFIINHTSCPRGPTQEQSTTEAEPATPWAIEVDASTNHNPPRGTNRLADVAATRSQIFREMCMLIKIENHTVKTTNHFVTEEF